MRHKDKYLEIFPLDNGKYDVHIRWYDDNLQWASWLDIEEDEVRFIVSEFLGT